VADFKFARVLLLCKFYFAGKGGCLKWYTVEAKDSYVKASLVTSFILPLAKHRWHTAVSLLSASNLVVCGDRRGSVHLFRKGILSSFSSW